MANIIKDENQLLKDYLGDNGIYEDYISFCKGYGYNPSCQLRNVIYQWLDKEHKYYD